MQSVGNQVDFASRNFIIKAIVYSAIGWKKHRSHSVQLRYNHSNVDTLPPAGGKIDRVRFNVIHFSGDPTVSA
jgi:hypothetical protein